MAKKLFSVDTTEIKSEAKTEMQQHVYSPLPEQWERLVASLQELPPRTAWVKQRAKRPVKIKTERIKPYTVTAAQLEEIQTTLACTHGVPVAQIERDLAPHASTPLHLSDWEQRQASQTIYSSASSTIFQAP